MNKDLIGSRILKVNLESDYFEIDTFVYGSTKFLCGCGIIYTSGNLANIEGKILTKIEYRETESPLYEVLIEAEDVKITVFYVQRTEKSKRAFLKTYTYPMCYTSGYDIIYDTETSTILICSDNVIKPFKTVIKPFKTFKHFSNNRFLGNSLNICFKFYEDDSVCIVADSKYPNRYCMWSN